VSTLRSLAGAMQRERTALKVMQQMLVARRNTATVEDVIPVGDSFDYIVTGRDALDSQAAALFRSADTLYKEKLRPLLLGIHGLTDSDADGPGPLPDGFRVDDRLAKTLLLSAVAPKVPALKELTASRLASLNHGSIRSPLPGSEAAIVLGKVKEWSKRVPEIHVATETLNPVIRVQLSDVDYQSVVERARGEDNEGRRRELIKELVREEIGVSAQDPNMLGALVHPVVWRGSRRDVDIVFGNVRDAGWLSEDIFHARPGTWRIVIDYPFDEPGHSGSEDLARLDRMIESGTRTQTVAWLPRFLSDERMVEVRGLVVLDWLLGGTGERWTSHADHLSEVERVQARAILESQRTALREGLRRVIQECYGAAAPSPGTLADGGTDDRNLVSLDPAFAPAAPVGASLGAAFANLVDQAFRTRYPDHPRFEPSDAEVTPRDLAAVYTHVQRAVADPDGRVRLEGDITAVRRVANALEVGRAGETHFLFGDDRFGRWGAAIERGMSLAGLQPEDRVTVGLIRDWIDAISPKVGLRDEVMDLIALAWAELRQRAWYQHGGPISPPKPGSARSEMELRLEQLPTPGDWKAAASRAEQIFGFYVNPYLTATAVAELAGNLSREAGVRADVATSLVHQVQVAYEHLGIAEDRDGRLRTARAGVELGQELGRASDRVGLVTALARANLPVAEAVLATSLAQGSSVSGALQQFRWERLAPLMAAESGTDHRGRVAAAILRELRAAVSADEFTVRLAPSLSAAEQAVFDWLAEGQSAARPPLPVSPGPVFPPVRSSGRVVVARGAQPDQAITTLSAFLDEHRDDEVVVEWRVNE
jgi:hypothetical protein